MIDVSQWRASIGIWSHCSATISRLAKSYCCSSSQHLHVGESNIVFIKRQVLLLTTLFLIILILVCSFFMISLCTLYLPKGILFL